MSAAPAIIAALRNSGGEPYNNRLIEHCERHLENAIQDINRAYQALADLEAKLQDENEATAWTALQSFCYHAGTSHPPASYLDSMTSELNQAYAFAIAVL